MTNISIAVLSAAEFEIARKLIPELATHLSYEDWLDYRYGMFMGPSLGGEDAQLVPVDLGPFLEWCDDRGLRPSESNLDAFGRNPSGRDARQAMESSASSVVRSISFTARKAKSSSPPLGPKSASRSVGVDV